MDISIIKAGTKLEIETISTNGDKIGQTYVSQFISMIDDEHVLIASPIHSARFMLIPPGTQVRIVFSHGIHGLLYFNGTIIKKEKKGNVIALYTKVESSLEKIQRRKYFRCDCILNALYRTVEDIKQKDETISTPFIKCLTKNISGSGICIVTEEAVPKNSLLQIRVMLQENKEVQLIGKLIRCIEKDHPKGKKYELGLRYEKLDSKDQEGIIKFVFDQQRKLLKKI